MRIGNVRSGVCSSDRRRALESCGDAPSEQDKADLAASFQQAVLDIILDRARNAIAMFDAMHGTRQKDGTQRHFVVAGGVAANAALRGGLVALAEKSGMADRKSTRLNSSH